MPVHRRSRGRRRSRQPSTDPAAVSRRSDGRATSTTRAPSPASAVPTARPSPLDPPPTRTRAPSRPQVQGTLLLLGCDGTRRRRPDGTSRGHLPQAGLNRSDDQVLRHRPRECRPRGGRAAAGDARRSARRVDPVARPDAGRARVVGRRWSGPRCRGGAADPAADAGHRRPDGRRRRAHRRPRHHVARHRARPHRFSGARQWPAGLAVLGAGGGAGRLLARARYGLRVAPPAGRAV